MVHIRTVCEDTVWVGASDRRLAKFENLFPIPRGVSYNTYVVLDEKTVLLDTVDNAVGAQFFENLEAALNGRALDYIVVNHMEPDHCGTLCEALRRWPNAIVVGNAKTFGIIGQFYGAPAAHTQAVADGDTLCTGKHTFTFRFAPMVHWPEVMVTYDAHTAALFSADAFGSFGAVGGTLFADEVDFARDWLDDARRYYANIVGKYGAQTAALLQKLDGLPVRCLCPLHGLVWRTDPAYFIEKYKLWSAYVPEERGVVICYGSMYGNTASAADALAGLLCERGVTNVRVYDASVTDVSLLISEIFRASALVLAAPTYNGGIYAPIAALLHDMKALGVRGRTVGLLENGTWAPQAARQMREQIEALRDMTLLEPVATLRSAGTADTAAQLAALADALAAHCAQ